MRPEERLDRIEYLLNLTAERHDRAMTQIDERFKVMSVEFKTQSVEFNDRIKLLSERMLEIEVAQANQVKAQARVTESLEEVSDRISNLTILVDRLVARDLNGNK